jgi:hypothetical protein
MKKTLTLHFALIMATLSSMAQTIVNPDFRRNDDISSTITKIERNNDFTVVHFQYTATGDSSWVQLNKEIYIQTNLNNEHYNYVKAENISMAPNKQYLKKAGDKLLFKVYFKKIPAEAKIIDIFERPGDMENGISYFNFYGVNLTRSRSVESTVTDVVLTPPPPADASNRAINMMDSMGPMVSSMTRSMMDAQLEYYKQPGKIKEAAKLTKQYYDALIKEGFSADQALKIITSDGLLPKSSVGGK